MFHFDGHTLFIKKVTFAMKSGEYFYKDNIMEQILTLEFVFPWNISM